jgi:hypothetical protein
VTIILISTIFTVITVAVSEMSKPTIHPGLQHLSDVEIEILTQKYLSGTKVSELISEFHIACIPSQLKGMLPPRVLEQSCSVCGSAMVQDLPSRSSSYSSPKIHCSSCLHEEGDRCRCKHCQELRDRAAAEEKARRRAVIAQALEVERAKYACSGYPAEILPLSLAVAFLAFTRCCPINEHGVYGPLDASPVPFAPTKAYTSLMLEFLRLAGLISVSEHSQDGSIFYHNSQLNFIPEKVCWSGDINQNLKLMEDIEVLALTGNWPAHWYGEVEEEWLNLALAECRAYYDHCLKERGLHVQSDQAITDMLKNILRDFSVGQCYRVIWMGARNASDYLARNARNRIHAGNYMVGACQRWADNARAEGYEVKPFKRNFDLPRSMMSYVLFDVILKIGERGFTEPNGLATLAGESENLW